MNIKNRSRHRVSLKLCYLLGICGWLFSCNSFLDEVPDNRAEVNDIESVKELLTAAYPAAAYPPFLDPRTDNVADKGPEAFSTESFNTDGYFWRDVETLGRDYPLAYWSTAYAAISVSNHALDILKKMDQDNEEVKEAKGEALLCRAYAHFILVNIWGETYHPADDSQLGVPYVSESENVALKDYKRNTVKEVYDLIEKDLVEGIPLISDNYKIPKYHFNIQAAHAFASRFYLFKGDWNKVIEYSNKVFEGTAGPRNVIRNWIVDGNLPYRSFQRDFSSIDKSTNLLLNSVTSLYARIADFRYEMDNPLLRRLFRTSTPGGFDWQYPLYGGDLSLNIPKYEEYFKFTNFTTQVGIPYTTFVLFSADEVLLNRAEAYALSGDRANALNDINDFMSTRTSASRDITLDDITRVYGLKKDKYSAFYPLPADNDGFALLDCILEFRRREFYVQGLRWFDIKRYHIAVLHRDIERNEYILDPFDRKRVLQIPEAAIVRGIEPNEK